MRRVLNSEVGIVGDAKAMIVESHRSERLAVGENSLFTFDSTVIALAGHKRPVLLRSVDCPIKGHRDIIPRARRDAHYGIIVFFLVIRFVTHVLRDWLHYHSVLGVRHFVLISNECDAQAHTAMLAAAARVGAPLGHDFCVINLSDNLKPWALIEQRLQLALQADFAMAFYNPRSKSRPEGFEKTLQILKSYGEGDRPVIFARAVSTPDERIMIVPLAEAQPDMADMQTVVLVGSSQTRTLSHKGAVLAYTPRSVKG